MKIPRASAAVFVCAPVVAVALWFMPPLLPSDYFVSLAARLLALVLLAGSFNLLMSYLALSSFGHSALFGVGGYALGILLRAADVDAGIGLVASLAAGAVVAAALGPSMLRAAGVYFILLSLAVGQVLWGIADSWRSVTGGSDGMIVYAVPHIFGVDLVTPTAIFRLVMVVAVIGTVGLYVIVHSAFGSVLRGVRESELRMVALGYNVFAVRLLAFVLSGAIGGLAGGLVTVVNHFVSPDAMSVRLAVELVLCVILGGRGTFWGPLVAAFALFACEEAISAFTPVWPLFLGLLFIAGVYVLRFDLLSLPRLLKWSRSTTGEHRASEPEVLP